MALAPSSEWHPILSEVKTKKNLSRMRTSEHPLRYAWEKLLREHDKTKRIYPVNPYTEVYQFRDNLYGLLQESLDGMGELWQFLTIGPEKAFLIDTGFGLGDLKGLCDELTGGMPLIVANTHSHFDHAYGNYQFDKVHCHEYEAPILIRNMNPHVWDYLFDDDGSCIWTEFDRNDLVSFKEYEVVPCPDGYTFDLGGGYEIELVFLPGHTPGHCGYLDKRNRIFFAGDDLPVATIGMQGGRPGMLYREFCSIEAFRNELVKVIARKGEFDFVFPSHSIVDMPTLVLDNMLETCDAILADPYDCDYYDEIEFEGRHVKRYGKSIPMSTYLFYDPELVTMEGIRKAETQCAKAS